MSEFGKGQRRASEATRNPVRCLPVALIPTNLRLPEDLKRAAQLSADEEGVSLSEWVRMAMGFRLAWELAGRAHAAGLPPEDLTTEAVTRLLGAALPWGTATDEPEDTKGPPPE